MSDNNNEQELVASQVNGEYFHANQGDDSIPGFINIDDYSGKDAKSHMHLLGIIEAEKKMAEQKYGLKRFEINKHEPFEFKL